MVLHVDCESRLPAVKVQGVGHDAMTPPYWPLLGLSSGCDSQYCRPPDI